MKIMTAVFFTYHGFAKCASNSDTLGDITCGTWLSTMASADASVSSMQSFETDVNNVWSDFQKYFAKILK